MDQGRPAVSEFLGRGITMDTDVTGRLVKEARSADKHYVRGSGPVTDRAEPYPARHPLTMRRPASFCVLALLAAACSAPPQGAATPVYNAQSRELERIDYDYNGDGAVDVRTYMQAGRPVRLEGDADADGRIDRWEYYDGQGRVTRVGASSQQDGIEDTWIYADGSDTRMEISSGRDGRIDRREYYRADVLLRAEADADRDGRIDTWEVFDNGRLASVAVDEDKRAGRATRRLVYGADGATRVEVDPDGDGTFVPDTTGGTADSAAADGGAGGRR